MPGEVIDEFSIKINADVDEMIETTQNAMQQIEDMFDEMVTKGLKIQVPESKTMTAMVEALDDINEAMGNTIETSQLVERSIRRLQDAGLSTAQAYVVLADAVTQIAGQTDALKELADAEAFELQSEMLGKVNEGLTIMESAWVAAGHAIPIEKLDALESKLIKIFRTGVFDQKLSLEETFARMDEAIVEALVPLDRLEQKLSQITPGQITFIADQMERVRQTFIDAGDAVPIDKLDALENRLDRIAKIAAVDPNDLAAMREGYSAILSVVDEYVERLTKVTEEQRILNDSFTEWEQQVADSMIADKVRELEAALVAAGKSPEVVIREMEKLERKLREIVVASAELGMTMPAAMDAVGVKTKETIMSLVKFKEEADGARGIMAGLVEKMGAAFGIDTQQMIKKVTEITKGADKVAQQFGINIGAISGAAMVAVGALALLAIGIAAIAKLASEGIALALRNAEAHQRFTLVIRQQQRAMGDLALSQAEARAAVSQLAEDFSMSNVEAENLLSTTTFLTRQFKLTGKEAVALADAAAVLGKSAGVNAESALRSVTNFMLTGYTQGLQQLGISISDAEVHFRAYRRGLVGLTEEVDDNTRALIAQEIIMEEAERSRQDAIDSTDTFANQIQEAATQTSEAKEALGEMFLGLKAAWDGFAAGIFEDIIAGLRGVIAFAILAGNRIQSLFAKMAATAELRDEMMREVDEAVAAGERSAPGFGQTGYTEEEFQERLTTKLQDIDTDALRRLDESLVKHGLVVKDVEKDNNAGALSFEELEIKIHEASQKIGEELEKLATKFADGMARIQQRLADTMAKIDKDFGRRRKDAARDLARDMRDIDASAQESAADAAADHNEDLVRLEEDHKLKMARLEDQYLFDIEDAVRERDARGVLSAQRRFNQQKKEAIQDKNLRTKRLKENFKNELQEIELERRRRRAERMLEFAEMNDDMALQEARRREDARLAFQNAERDLIASNRRKEKILADGFRAQFEGSNIAMNALYEMMNDYIGPGGFMEALYDSIAAYAAATNLNPSLSSYAQSTTVTDDPDPLIPGRARGGTMFATSPTLAMFGEGGPERVDFTPLSQSTGEPRAGFGGGGGGGATDINVDIGLEEGLVADIVDQSLDATANVITTMTRKKKQGAR